MSEHIECYTKETIEIIVNCGAFRYSARQIANILDWNVAVVIRLMGEKDSELAKLIQKGRDMSDYQLDLKLFEMAKAGDIKAMERLELRKSKR